MALGNDGIQPDARELKVRFVGGATVGAFLAEARQLLCKLGLTGADARQRLLPPLPDIFADAEARERFVTRAMEFLRSGQPNQ